MLVDLNLVNFLGSAISVLAMVITVLVIQPLKTEIKMLHLSIDKLSQTIELDRAAISVLKEHSASFDSSIKSAHKRIDALDGKIIRLQDQILSGLERRD